MRLEDGGGKNGFAKINGNQQVTNFSVIETEQSAATNKGDAYNISTGLVALTGTAENALLYFLDDESPKNGESGFIITSIIFGLFTRSGTVTDSAYATVYRNPTGGTLIDAASSVPINSNANFGKSESLSTSSLAYKATASAQTFTGASEHAPILIAEGRTIVPIVIELGRGSSIGVSVDLNTDGGANIYCTLVGHRKDGLNA